jgi:chromosome segregation ATPase
MDGLPTPTTGRRSYRTPVSILVPKLVHSRDNWKAKSDRRKHQLKLANLTIRDLTLSRDSWRRKYQELQQQNHNLQQQLEQTQSERDQAQGALAQAQEAKKK